MSCFKMTYIEEWAQKIFPVERKVVPEQFSSIATSATGTGVQMPSILSCKGPIERQTKTRNDSNSEVYHYSVRFGFISSRLGVSLWSYDNISDTGKLGDAKDTPHKNRTSSPHKRLSSTDDNISKKSIGLDKHLCISLCTTSPECFVDPDKVDRLKRTLEGNAVYYKHIKDRQT